MGVTGGVKFTITSARRISRVVRKVERAPRGKPEAYPWLNRGRGGVALAFGVAPAGGITAAGSTTLDLTNRAGDVLVADATVYNAWPDAVDGYSKLIAGKVDGEWCVLGWSC